jgi:hypothetical protein
MTADTRNRFAVDNFPPELQARFKSNAALAGMSMQRCAILAIEEWCHVREQARLADNSAAVADAGWLTERNTRETGT